MSSPTSRTIQLILPMPETCLWPNRMSHWTKKARAKKRQRQSAEAIALPHRPRMRGAVKSGNIDFAFHWPDRRRRDMDNALAAMKSGIDGLKDAALIEDDSGFSFSVRRLDADKGRDAEVVVTITEAP